jgi:hypothetical protein
MGENFSPIFKPTLDKPEIIMNVIKTQADAINFLQIGTTGDEILDQLDKLPYLIVTDSDNDVSSTMNEDESEIDDTWAPLPEGLFEDDSEEDEDDDDITAYTSPYEDAIS